MTHARRRCTALVTPLTLLIVITLAMSAFHLQAQAQDDPDPPHPAHIHSGSCDNLGDIVFPLSDVVLDTAGETFGADSAIPVKESETSVEASLSDILSAPHAINIHQSAEEIQIYIACGDIGGRVVDGQLLIGLQEIDGSGHNGVARLVTADDTTDVWVVLAEQEVADGEEVAPAADTPAAADETPAAAAETPAAAAAETPAAEEADAEPAAVGQDVPVDIRDFAFSPNPVEIAVGDTVTWTNQDEVPHTATGEDRAVLQSGTISPGSSFSQTFETAGEFPYFCEFHPNMQGTIVVQ
jgi:plastocyanin